MIVVAGEAINGAATDIDFALARYNSEGTLDNSFDSDGKLTTDFDGRDDSAISVAIQADGKIVVVGWSYSVATNNDIAMARYNANGSLDTSFDGDGKLTLGIGSSADSVR